jgi:soluble cytochrome b562
MAAKLRLAPMLIVIAAGLVACGDNEATQRKAFIEFLQSRIVAKPGVHVPKPTSEETASFGDYAQHYAVIADFNTALDQAVSKPLQQTIAAGAPRSLDEVVTKRKEIGTMRDGMATLRGALDQKLAAADAAHAALKQPDDLKPVYDAAYDRDVTQPVKAMINIFPDVDEAMKAILALAEFLDQHSDTVKIDGSMVRLSNPALQGQLQDLLNAVRVKQEAVQKAQQRLRNIAYGN